MLTSDTDKLKQNIHRFNNMGHDLIYHGIRYRIQLYKAQYRVICELAEPEQVPKVLDLIPGVQVIRSIANIHMQELNMPDSVELIDGLALFNSTNLRKIKFSRNITSAGTMAFAGCHSLQTADLHECKLKELPKECFMSCTELEEIYLPECLTYIGRLSFMGCHMLTRVYLPAKATVSKEAFAETVHSKKVIRAERTDSTGHSEVQERIGWNSEGNPVFGIYYSVQT